MALSAKHSEEKPAEGRSVENKEGDAPKQARDDAPKHTRNGNMPPRGTIIRPGDEVVPYKHVKPTDEDPEGWEASEDALAALRFANHGPEKRVRGEETQYQLHDEPYHEV